MRSEKGWGDPKALEELKTPIDLHMSDVSATCRKDPRNNGEIYNRDIIGNK